MSYSYVFVGRVLPERTYVTLTTRAGGPLQFAIPRKDGKIDYRVALSISVAQILAAVTSEEAISDLATLKNDVSDLVSMVLDVFGYLEGRGYLLEITLLFLPNGKMEVFGVEIPELQTTKGDRPLTLDQLLRATSWNVGTDSLEQAFHRVSLRYGLSDLRQAILSAGDTLFHTYRAINGIMQGFREPLAEGDEEEGWRNMRTALRIDESALRTLAKNSAAHRHGYHPPVTGNERVSAIRFAWRVVDRFAVYINGGFNPLTSDYALLDS